MLGQERELVVQLQSKLNLMLGASSRIGLGVLAVAYPFALRTVSKIVLHTGFGPARLGQSTYGAPGGCAGESLGREEPQVHVHRTRARRSGGLQWSW